MIHLDAPSVFIGWAVGITVWQVAIGRLEPVRFGHAWVLRVFSLVLLGGSSLIAAATGWVWARDTPGALAAGALATAVVTSVRAALGHAQGADDASVRDRYLDARAMRLDAFAGLLGLVALVAASLNAAGPVALSLTRSIVGAAFLGGLTSAMIFGHRLLAKPWLGRRLMELATAGMLFVWPLEVIALLIPTGMISVLNGTVDDGYAGILGWMWATCAVATGALLVLAKVILRDKDKTVLAAATGMLYLAALTGFGTNLIARAVLSG